MHALAGTAIFECNNRCDCDDSCPNRVVQRGRRVRLCIYRTPNKGWAVKTLQRIKEGAFVLEYLGELTQPAPDLHLASPLSYTLCITVVSKLQLFTIERILASCTIKTERT